MRFGILGLHHDHVWGLVPPLLHDRTVKLVGAADPYPQLRARFAGETGAPAHEDYSAILDDDSLDAVLVFASNQTSASLATEAAKRGRHVLLEKPLAASLAGAQAMVEASQASQTQLMVNWPFTWWPALQHALDLASSGAIGRVWQVKYRAAHRGPAEMGCTPFFCEWLFDEERNGGGAFMDYCCYGAILSAVVLGPPETVFASASNLCKSELTVDDNALLHLRYDRAQALLEASWTQIDEFSSYIATFYGETGTLSVDGNRRTLLHGTLDQPRGVELAPPIPEPHQAEPVAHFLAAIRNGQPLNPLSAPDGNLLAQKILEAGKISLSKGHPVSFHTTASLS